MTAPRISFPVSKLRLTISGHSFRHSLLPQMLVARATVSSRGRHRLSDVWVRCHGGPHLVGATWPRMRPGCNGRAPLPLLRSDERVPKGWLGSHAAHAHLSILSLRGSSTTRDVDAARESAKAALRCEYFTFRFYYTLSDIAEHATPSLSSRCLEWPFRQHLRQGECLQLGAKSAVALMMRCYVNRSELLHMDPFGSWTKAVTMPLVLFSGCLHGGLTSRPHVQRTLGWLRPLGREPRPSCYSTCATCSCCGSGVFQRCLVGLRRWSFMMPSHWLPETATESLRRLLPWSVPVV